MRCLRFPIALALMAIWLLPGILSGTLVVHLAFDHHELGEHSHDAGHAHADHASDHEHAEGPHSDADCGLGSGDHADLSSTLADIVSHGHEHEEADATHHEHDFRVSSSKIFERPGSHLLTLLPPSDAGTSLRSMPTVHGASEHPCPPLFRSNCALLI